MFIFGIIFLVVALVLIGIGLAIGALIFVAAAAAIGVGMISSSVACGILQKKPSAGFRVFFYQFFTLTFLAAGIVLTWLVSAFAELHFSGWSIVAIGSLAGISVGLLFSILHSYLVDVIAMFANRLFHR